MWKIVFALKGGITTFSFWTKSAVGIGIGGKMFKDMFLLKKIKIKIYFYFRIKVLLHLGVPTTKINSS